jgi:hypothetical protein
VADGCCAWDEFALVALTEAGVAAGVESVKTSAHPSPARRPVNGCLKSIRYRALRPWREGVREWAAGLKTP